MRSDTTHPLVCTCRTRQLLTVTQGPFQDVVFRLCQTCGWREHRDVPGITGWLRRPDGTLCTVEEVRAAYWHQRRGGSDAP